jgi:hypothetical protein
MVIPIEREDKLKWKDKKYSHSSINWSASSITLLFKSIIKIKNVKIWGISIYN